MLCFFRWYCANSYNTTNRSFLKVKPTSKSYLFSTTPTKLLRGRYKNNKNIQSLEPHFEGLVVESEHVELSRLWKPFLFTIAVSQEFHFTNASFFYYHTDKFSKKISNLLNKLLKLILPVTFFKLGILATHFNIDKLNIVKYMNRSAHHSELAL